MKDFKKPDIRFQIPDGAGVVACDGDGLTTGETMGETSKLLLAGDRDGRTAIGKRPYLRFAAGLGESRLMMADFGCGEFAWICSILHRCFETWSRRAVANFGIGGLFA